MARLQRPLVAIDWGTSALRGARLDPDGAVLEERHFPRGITTVEPGGFRAVFDACFADWMTAPDTLGLIAGMAGSRQGWQEAPYCPCPAGFDELARHLLWIEPGRLAIVPGLSCRLADGIPDVMRGEEVQIFGALAQAGRRDALVVLPGTHSKWARVRDGRVTGFRTAMTGEFYALLSRQSLLARTLDADAPFDPTAFDEGVRRALDGAGLLHSAFGVRTRALFAERDPGALASHLSGLLIGEELRAFAPGESDHRAAGSALLLVGAEALTRRYARAFGVLGWTCAVAPADAGWRGLRALAARDQPLLASGG